MSREFASESIRLNVVDLLDQASDPSSGGGVAAAIGSWYLRSGTAGAYLKTGAAATGWQQLVQSFAWKSVLDYGADPTGATDSTAAVQQAITDSAGLGGGVVYFPVGTYAVTQLTMTGNNVQLQGAGGGSIIKWTWNAATAAGSMITVSGGASKLRFEMLRFDGSGLTNPAASRGNHLIQVGNGVTGATEIQIFRCHFSGMVANSGDGVHAIGVAGNLISRIWVCNNSFNGCSRFGVCYRQGLEYGWIESNFFTNQETDIAAVASADLNTNCVTIFGNEIVHTGTVRHALRVEGGATTQYTRVIVAENTIVGGFCTYNNVKWGVLKGNVVTSGAFASTDSVMKISGNLQQLAATANLYDRDPGASAGPCMSLEKTADGAPSLVRVGQHVLINEKQGGTFITVVDCTKWSIGGCLCRSSDAGASVLIGVDVQAVTVALTDAQIGPGNQFTAAAGSMAACVRLLANGANITDCSIVGNQGNNCDYGVRYEVGGGGGTFNGQLLRGTNNFDATTGDLQQTGVTVIDRIGLNAGTFGANYWSGAGSPEGVVTARVGSIFSRTDGGQATAFYYKETGTAATGWIAMAGDMIAFGADDLAAGTGTVFFAPGYIATASATEIQIAVTRPGTIRNLRVQIGTAGTGVGTVTFTARKNGVDQTLTCNIGNTSTGLASDLVNSFTVAAADLISIKIVKGAGVTNGQKQVACSVELA